MYRRRFIWLYLSIALLAFGVVSSQGDNPLPPFPASALDVKILFPNALVTDTLTPENPVQRYLILLEANSEITLRVDSGGNFYPTIRLIDQNEEVVAEGFADMVGREASLSFTSDQAMWYWVEVTNDTGSVPDGDYHLEVGAAAPNIYQLLPQGTPPTTTPVLLNNTVDIPSGTYLIPLVEDQSLTIQSTSLLQLTNLAGTVLATGEGQLDYTSDQVQWVSLHAEASFGVEFRANLFVLADLITFTPAPTATVTPVPTATLVPTATPTPLPTATPYISVESVEGLQLLHVLQGHDEAVWRIRFNEDGTRLASASYDETIKLWDTQSGELLHSYSGHTADIEDLDFRNGVILSGAYDTAVWLWDPQSYESIHNAYAHNNSVTAVALSPDGQWLASASEAGGVFLWDAATFTVKKRYSTHSNVVWDIAFSPDSSWLASVGSDQRLKIRDVQTGRIVYDQHFHDDDAMSVTFSADGALIATADWGGNIYILDTNTLSIVQTIRGTSGPIHEIAFNPTATLIASANSSPSTVTIWDVQTGEALAILQGHNGWVRSVQFSHDGQLIASSSDDGNIHIWGLQ